MLQLHSQASLNNSVGGELEEQFDSTREKLQT